MQANEGRSIRLVGTSTPFPFTLPMRTHDTQFVFIIIIDRFYAFIAALWRRGTTKIEARRKLHRQIKARRKLALPPCTSIEFVNDFAKHQVLPQDPRPSRPVRISVCKKLWQKQNSRRCMHHPPTWAFVCSMIANNAAEMLLLIWIFALFNTGAAQTAALPCHFLCFHEEHFYHPMFRDKRILRCVACRWLVTIESQRYETNGGDSPNPLNHQQVPFCAIGLYWFRATRTHSACKLHEPLRLSHTHRTLYTSLRTTTTRIIRAYIRQDS